jgi:hypothetical protein
LEAFEDTTAAEIATTYGVTSTQAHYLLLYVDKYLLNTSFVDSASSSVKLSAAQNAELVMYQQWAYKNESSTSCTLPDLPNPIDEIFLILSYLIFLFGVIDIHSFSSIRLEIIS